MRAFRTLACMLALAAAAPVAAKTLAQVGSEAISAEEFQAALAAEQASRKQELSQAERSALLQSMVNQRLLVLEARKLKLDRDPGFKAEMAGVERQKLVEAVYQREVAAKAAVSLEQAKEFYAQNPALFDVVELSQIVISDKDDPAKAEKSARALAEKLARSPKDFAKEAKKRSDDPQSRERGGDVGTLRRGMLLPALEGAAFSAKPGSVVGPVQTQFGWHILHVRDAKRLTWEQAGGPLQAELQRLRAQQLQSSLLDGVKKSVKVKIQEGPL